MHRNAVMSHCKACFGLLWGNFAEPTMWTKRRWRRLCFCCYCVVMSHCVLQAVPAGFPLFVVVSFLRVQTFLHFFVLFFMSSQFLQSHTNATTKVEVEAFRQIRGPRRCFCSHFSLFQNWWFSVTPLTSQWVHEVWWLNCSKYNKNEHAAERHANNYLDKASIQLIFSQCRFPWLFIGDHPILFFCSLLQLDPILHQKTRKHVNTV